MKRIMKEFKQFINKGSVMDLAVGMIIGAAFTAIVTALVKNILTPLISWIPGSKQTGTLQTILKPAVIDTNGNILAEALILDWGAVISAVITFLVTAIVLFFIVKAINKFKSAGEKVITKIEAVERKIKGEYEEEDELREKEEAEMVVEKETTEELLKQIVILLKQGQDKEEANENIT